MIINAFRALCTLEISLFFNLVFPDGASVSPWLNSQPRISPEQLDSE